VASLSQGRTAAAQCGLFTHKSVPVIFEPPCTFVATSLVTRMSDTTIGCRVLSLHVRISFCDARRVRQQQGKVDPMRHPLTEEGGKHSFLIIRV